MTAASTENSALRRHWNALTARERSLVLAATGLVVLALLWWLTLAPALATLRTAPARHALLDRQLQQMLGLQAEAQQLQASARARPADAVAALRSTLAQSLGASARLAVLGDRATVNLQGACADALAHWLAQARSSAQAAPLAARLTRSAAQPPAQFPARSTALSTPGAPGAYPVVAHAAAARPDTGAATAITAAAPAPAPCSAASMPRWDGTLALALAAPAAD